MGLREIAMEWWNDLSFTAKGNLIEAEFKHRHPQALSGSEIERLYKREHVVEKYEHDSSHNPLFVFVYAKDGFVKVLNIEDSRAEHQKLLDEGYVRTATLDVCTYIVYIANCQDDKEILSTVKGLRTLSQT
jgi:hypothetical protein